MAVDRLPVSRTYKDKESEHARSVKNLEIVIKNLEALKSVRNGEKMARYAVVLKNKVDSGEELFDWEYSEIDNLYERTISAVYDVPHVPKHFDRPRGNLRHPR